MLATLLSALLCGIFAGLAPGPYTTMVAATALERGFKAGVRLALVPLLSDIPPLLICLFVLDRLDPQAFGIVGVFGGALLIAIGIRFYRRHRNPDPHLIPDHAPPSAPFLQVVLSTLLSPAPWLFWFIVAGPLMLRALHRSNQEALVFLVVLFGTNVSSATALAWAISHGRRLVSPRWQRRVLSLAGIGLIGAGSFLLWQGFTGNFADLIAQQHRIREFVEDGMNELEE